MANLNKLIAQINSVSERVKEQSETVCMNMTVFKKVEAFQNNFREEHIISQENGKLK